MIDTNDLLTDLTPPQREAVTHIDGPLLVVAGAGSGKTRVLTRRVAYLIAQGVPPSAVLAITFTNKAAGEMRQRVGDVTGRPIRDFGRLNDFQPTICTFHSLCLRILRHYAPAVGMPANFTIYDTADQSKVIKDSLKALDIGSTNFSPGTVLGTISNAKNHLMTAAEFAREAGDFYAKTVARVYTKYQETLEANAAVDFDDLLMKVVLGFKKDPQMLRELQDRYSYVLIDEYQDTNHAQYTLARALTLRHKNLCVVGDPDQSIYAWRGADIKNILDFENDFPNAAVVRLEQNYRSTKTILHLASTLIAQNTARKDKTLWTENDDGMKAPLVLCQDEQDEARQVADWLAERNKQDGVSWDEMAVFYRMNSLSRVMEDALRRSSIPYIIARGVEFYNRKEIKDVLAYLKAVSNRADDVSVSRIMNVPARGISSSTEKSLTAFALSEGLSIDGALRQAEAVEGLSARAISSCKEFVGLLDRWRKLATVEATVEPQAPVDAKTGEMFPESAAAELVIVADDEDPARPKGTIQRVMEDVVRRSGLEAFFKKADPDAEKEVPNVNELISSAAEYDALHPDGTLADYLSAVSLVSDTDAMKGGGGAVTLMTLHAAKGLEFPVVAMIGLEEGILPHSRARTNPDDLEEERRLAFVGITRCERRLMLSKANYRTIRGVRERTVASPFLNELPPESLEVIDRTGLAGIERYSGSSSPGRATDSGLRVGAKVRHPAFGVGTVKELSERGSSARLVVDFATKGTKTLLMPPAPLAVLP